MTKLKGFLILFGRINLPALFAGIIFIYVALKRDYWWIAKSIGDKPTFFAGVAPYRIDIMILGKDVVVNGLPYIELSGFLTCVVVGVLALIGAFLPKKDLSKSMVGFRPLIIPVVIVISVYIGVMVAGRMIGTRIPFLGSSPIIFTLHYGSYTIYIQRLRQ